MQWDHWHRGPPLKNDADQVAGPQDIAPQMRHGGATDHNFDWHHQLNLCGPQH